MEHIINDKGKLINSFTENDFGKYVITGIQAGNQPMVKYLGRLIQVRLEAGDFGSDTVFLRHPDASLGTHANQCFFRVKEKYYKELDGIYTNMFDVDDADNPYEFEYTIAGEFPEKGFIVPSKVKEGETTPMRDIKGKIMNQLNNLSNK